MERQTESPSLVKERIDRDDLVDQIQKGVRKQAAALDDAYLAGLIDDEESA